MPQDSTKIRIISTTLCGSADVGKVADALHYASLLVDAHIVIWTGEGAAPTELVAASRATSAPTTLHAWRWTGSFADARNASLEFARESGADFSVMVDADERVVCPDAEAARAWIAALPQGVQIVTAHTVEGTYTRERLFRTDIAQRWYLRTHECIDAPPGARRPIPRVMLSWSEIMKTAEGVEAKCARDLELLDLDLADHPGNPRVMFYKGQTLDHMGRFQEAIDCYRVVAKANAGEGAAWACFCAARNYLRLPTPNLMEALNACHASIQREPRLAEPYWLAGSIYHDLGLFEWGIAYERKAQLFGDGSEGADDLGGFRVPIALGDGPQQVIDLCRAALKAQGGPSPKLLAAGTAPAHRVEPAKPDTSRIHITVTSTGFRAAEWAPRCIESVARQTKLATHWYVAADAETLAVSPYRTDPRAMAMVDGIGKGLLENLLPIWRSLPPDEVIVWLDGDDWLATDHALARVAEAHAAGALVTYGSFVYADGRPGFAGQCGANPRAEPWRATHLKSFRAGLVSRVRESDWRWNDGSYLDLAIDQAVMLPVLEMAGPERSVFIPETLAVYNEAHGFFASASDAEKAREMEAVMLIRSRRPYERIGDL